MVQKTYGHLGDIVAYVPENEEFDSSQHVMEIPARYAFMPVEGELVKDGSLSLNHYEARENIACMDAIHVDPITEKYVLTINVKDRIHAEARYNNWKNVTKATLKEWPKTRDLNIKPKITNIADLTVEIDSLPF